MRHVWTVVCVLALANLLALVGFALWLNGTGRLSDARVEEMRRIFSVPVAEQQRLEAEAAAQAEREKAGRAEAERLARPPVTAAQRIESQQEEAERQLQTVLRQQQELDNLRAALMHQLAKLEERERQLAEDRAAFEASRERIAQIEGAQQFRTALVTLEGQRPKDAKAVLQALLDEGAAEQVVAYLAKMDESKRAKVVAEFVKDRPEVAADLLEQLRTRGIVPASPDLNATARPDDATRPAQSLAAP